MHDPADPITELAQRAAEMHEMYTAFRDAGFTEDQALELVIAIVIQAGSG
ncbi:hypothetical protein [Streptomyces sp. NPDC001404]